MQISTIRLLTLFIIGLLNFSSWQPAIAQDSKLEFFETKIRPVLIEHCYKCHNSVDRAEGDFAVDWKTGIRTESGQGIAVVPGKPQDSLLLKVIRHEIVDIEMPADGAKLTPDVIHDFEKWISQGAIDPRVEPPSSDELAKATSWEAILEKRKQWWSFQPIKNPTVPPDTVRSAHPIDRFIEKKLTENGVVPARPADRQTLIRRLSYALTGLPPTIQQIKRFVADTDPKAYENLVDELMASTHFGERWARHWMDLVRYADSHGSEGDPAIPNIYRYRDYLIRAFNQDVPYDELVIEHIAGDLIAQPRINQQLGINESAIGTAHWRMVFHGFAPTDALDEKVRFTDDQINVFGKTFQALTISCARCHDHKFDAISQADYYALFGVLGSCRPTMQDVNSVDRQALHKNELKQIKSKLRTLLADQWLGRLDEIEQRLMQKANSIATGDQKNPIPAGPAVESWKFVIEKTASGQSFFDAWAALQEEWSSQGKANKADIQINDAWRWSLGSIQSYAMWFPSGNGLESTPANAGDFVVSTNESKIVQSIFPSGVYSHLHSKMHRGQLGSPRFLLDDEYDVWLLIRGGNGSSVRYVVQDYPRNGTVYPINNINRQDWYWHKLDLAYWKGDQVHIELVTGPDAPLQVNNNEQSWFGIREAIVRKKGQPAPPLNTADALIPLMAHASIAAPTTTTEFAECYQKAIASSIQLWRDGKCTDSAALFLDACLQDGLLSNSLAANPAAKKLIEEYRRIEKMIPIPTRVPGVAEADSYDQPLFERGNHKKPLAPVRRRFLEAIDSTPFTTRQSGRLELANAIVDSKNPLTSRVIVNRIWHHLFGRGIVATPDNFGKLGALPTHPELLDHLAARMMHQGWSIKDTIRYILLSQTWQQDSTLNNVKADPTNKWFSRAKVRRLDAESIRDSLLLVSGQLDTKMYGPGFGANSTSGRRSIYVLSRRNSLDQFLQTFDAPIPFATTGRRNVTNVPAQSLTMLNDPFVLQLAKALEASTRQPGGEKDPYLERAAKMTRLVLGREPANGEPKQIVSFVETLMRRSKAIQNELSTHVAELKQVNKNILEIIAPARERLLQHATDSKSAPDGVSPIARWDFTKGLNDSVGNLAVTLQGDAQQSSEGLILNGNGFATTGPIVKPVQEKTLEVWLQLTDLNQRGGGVITIQDLSGNIFDSIVFGEQAPGHWMSGSNVFARTRSFDGPAQETTDSTVHFAITYSSDGTIAGYRNGLQYGKAYRKSAVVRFDAENGQFIFGLRHGTAVTSGRMLKGTIKEARFYDRVLSAEEIASSAGGLAFISRKDVLESLSDAEQKRVIALEEQKSNLQNEIESIGVPIQESDAWTRAALALFNLKEFIYIR